MSKALPRGLHRRGDSLVATFALADGAIERRSLGEVSISWATEQLSIYKRQVREGSYQKKQPRAKEVSLTVAHLWAAYLRTYKLAGKKSAWRQEAAWLHLSGTFESMRPEQITTASVTAYQESRLAEGASAGTINRELSALSACLFCAAKMTGPGGKPLLERVVLFPSKLKESAPRKGFVTDREYAVLARNAKPLWLRALIECAYSFGFRRGELLNLRVRQVDFFGRWIQLEQGTTKNNEARKIKMTSEVFELMRACVHGKNPDDSVFTREDGKTPVRDPRDDWYTLCVASGLGQFIPAKRANGEDYSKYVGLNLHDFRRSAIRNLTRRGVSQTVAMRISGHKTASVFRRYDIVDEGDLEAATAKIEAGREVFAESGTGTSTKTDTVTFSSSAIAS